MNHLAVAATGLLAERFIFLDDNYIYAGARKLISYCQADISDRTGYEKLKAMILASPEPELHLSSEPQPHRSTNSQA